MTDQNRTEEIREREMMIKRNISQMDLERLYQIKEVCEKWKSKSITFELNFGDVKFLLRTKYLKKEKNTIK